MRPVNGRTPGVIVSVAHLDDEERAPVLGVLMEEVLAWVRSLPGTQRLRLRLLLLPLVMAPWVLRRMIVQIFVEYKP